MRYGRERILLVTVARDDNDLGMRRQPERLRECCETLFDPFRLRRQTEVLEDDRRLVPPQFDDGIFTVFSRENFVTFEAPFELVEQTRVVFDNEQLAGGFGHWFP